MYESVSEMDDIIPLSDYEKDDNGYSLIFFAKISNCINNFEDFCIK